MCVGVGVCGKQLDHELNTGLSPSPVSFSDFRHVIFPICKTELVFLVLHNELCEVSRRALSNTGAISHI